MVNHKSIALSLQLIASYLIGQMNVPEGKNIRTQTNQIFIILIGDKQKNQLRTSHVHTNYFIPSILIVN